MCVHRNMVIPIMSETQLASIDLNLLVTLDVLLTEGSVTVAARRLHLSQSAVSRALAKLREMFDDELFVRTGQGMRPTRRALELAAPLRRALTQLGAVLDSRERFDPTVATRSFEIAALDYTQLTLLAPWTTALPATAPNVDVVIRQLSIHSKRDLEAGDLDLYIAPRTRTVAGVVWTPLHDDDYTCVVWSENPVRRLTRKRFASMDHVLVAPRERPGGIVDRVLAEHALSRRVCVQVSNFASAPDLLIGTQRVATLPRRLAELFVARHPLRILEAPVPLPRTMLHLGWHEIHRDDPGHAWLRAQLLEQAGAALA